MEHIADPAKVLTAYKIINQQLANEIQKKRGEIKLHEERYNATCEMLLRERQENKALRDMVRKLKDQMQIITNVIVSVQDQTVSVYDRINRPHEQAEAMMQNYTPRAQQVYERRRTENPPYVDEDAIQEEEQEQEEGTNAEPELAPNGHDDTRPNEGSSGSNNDADDADETYASNHLRSTSGGPLPMNSPLVQRLKRPSKNTSFDESFETIDRERAFKLSRHSHGRRQIYMNVEENISDLHCSTPVSKGCTNERPPPAVDAEVNRNRELTKTRGRNRTVQTGKRGRPRKVRSETELHTLLNPVVMLRPLTEKNVQVHERKMRPGRKAKPVGSLKEYEDSNSSHHKSFDDSTFAGIGGGLEPCSSTENLSTVSGDSWNRPRRKAAPKTLREPSLGTKLRRN
uniref:Shugoshin C-terminal domain-containing protein n=1 Tax=Anopheles maculatus TaxID=74869 RepID=A0A182S994_9DIPT